MRLMAIRQARREPLALTASGHERMVNGWAAASGEEKFDLPEGIARFGDILNMEGPLVEIGSRSVFDTLTIRRLVEGSSQRGRVYARPDPAGPGGCRRGAWGVGRKHSG